MALLRLRSAFGPSSKLVLRSFSSAAAGADVPDSWRNPAAVLHGIDDIRFQDMPLPDEVADGHVRVQMRAVGICGSDVHYYKKVSHGGLFRKPNNRCEERVNLIKPSATLVGDGTSAHVYCFRCVSSAVYLLQGRVGHFVVNAPMILGHESAG